MNIATHLIADAFDSRFDTALIVCADADLVPAIAFIKARFAKRIILIDPPRRHSDELAGLADAHLHLSKHKLGQSQLPNPVEITTRRGKPKRFFRPETWT